MLREDQVSNSVGFLTHPSVASRTREDKASFLRSKGLSQEEVDEAFRRADAQLGVAPSVAAQQQQQQQQQLQQHQLPTSTSPQIVYQPVYPPPEPLWARILMPASLGLSAAAGLAYLYKTFVMNDRNDTYFPWEMQPPPLGPQPPTIIASGSPLNSFNNALTALPGTASPLQPPGGVTNPNPPSNALALPGGATPPPPSDLVATVTNVVQDHIAPLRRSVDEQTHQVREMVTSLKDVVQLLQQQQQQQTAKETKPDATLQMVLAMHNSSELRSELSAIKALLLSSQMRGGNGLDASTAALLLNKTSSASVSGGGAAAAGGMRGNGDMTDDLSRLAGNNSALNGSGLNVSALDGSSSPRSDSSTPGSTRAAMEGNKVPSTEDDDTRIAKEKTQKAREALATLISSCGNDSEALSQACNLLLLFLCNILKDPMLPRIRRVVRSNPNFKKSLEPLEGHTAFLSAVGFEERGPLAYELGRDWVESLEKDAADGVDGKPGWAKTVLTDAIANLELAKSSRGGNFGGGGGSGAGVGGSNNASVGSSSAGGVGGMHHNSDEASPKPTPSPSYGTPTSPGFQNGNAKPYQQQQQQQQQSRPSTSAWPMHASFSGPKSTNGSEMHEEDDVAPLSLKDLARMQEEGIRPPGVRDIPDKLSADSPSPATGPPPPKPWETSNFPSSRQVPVMGMGGPPTSFADLLAASSRSAIPPPQRARVEITEVSDEDGAS